MRMSLSAVASAMYCICTASIPDVTYGQTDSQRQNQNQGEVTEVLVTANRQGAESLQTVPMAITAVNPESLNREGIQSLADIARSLPGISVQEFGGGQNTIVIRGIVSQGTPDPTNVEDQPLVSVYLDDTPISLAGSTPDLRVFDLERLEVIRGPQGTLYGSGAMAGTIRYITKKPDTNAFGATVESSGADTHNGAASYSIRGMLNVPLISEAAALRISAYQGREGGYIDNLGTGTPNANSQENTQARAALRFDNGSPLTVDASFLYGHVINHGDNDVFSQMGPFQYSTNQPEFYGDRFNIFNLAPKYSTDWFDILSSTSYTGRHFVVNDSYQYGAAAYFGLNTQASNLLDESIAEFTQEMRLSSRRQGPLRWQTGLFYERQTRFYRQDFPAPGLDAELGINSLDYAAFEPDDVFSEIQRALTRQLAFFGEATYQLFDRLDLTAGLRRFHWTQTFSLFAGGIAGAVGPGQPLAQFGSSSENGINPRFNAAYHIDENLMVYAEAARGFRYGGINQPIPEIFCGAALAEQGLTSTPPTYGPDHLWTYSLGERASLGDRRFIVNVTGFFTRWSNVQTRRNLSCGYYYERNKGDVRSAGLELETSFRVTNALHVGLNGSYTDAVADGPIADLNAVDGARVPYFPRDILTVWTEYDVGLPFGTLQFRGDYNYRSATGTLFDPTDPLYRQIPASRIANAAATLVLGHTTWTVFANNLTDERIVSAILPNTAAAGGQPCDMVYLGRPRTLGVKAAFQF